ncbi:MAG: Lipid A core--O-antigen ligase-like protein [Parcubacteria group bacterium Gr01-1014_72]|nr:MAG: Lipid A core--O-antigen ligase-like protein [Parcubacteria group bacterium Gr01-1014_72]
MTLDRILRYGIFACLFAVPFIPLIVSDGLFFPFISGKNFAFRILTEIAFALWVLLALRDPSVRPRRSYILWCLGAFLAIVGVADLMSESPYKSFWSNFERMEGFIGFIHLFFYFLVLSSLLQGERIWSRFWHVSIGVLLASDLYALLQLAKELNINQGGVRVDATFGNAIYFAGYLVFNIFLLGFLWYRRRLHPLKDILLSVGIGFGLFSMYYLYRLLYFWSICAAGDVEMASPSRGIYECAEKGGESITHPRLRTALYAGIGLLSFYIFFYTGTRGAVLALVGGVLLLGVLLLSFGRLNKKMRIAGGAAVAIFLIAIGTFFTVRDIPAVRAHKIFGRFASISLDNDDVRARFYVWNMAWQGFKERPVLGWGQESFNYVFNKYYDPKMHSREQWFDRTHNIFLDWLISAGVLGLLAYLSLFAVLLYYVWRSRETSPVRSGASNGASEDERGVSIGEKIIFTAFLGAYFLHNVFVFDNLISYILFFSLLAYIHGRVGVSGAKVKRVGENVPATGLPFLYGGGTIFLCIISLYYFNVRPILAGHELILALRPHPPEEGGVSKNFELFKSALTRKTFASSEIREQLALVSTQVASSNLSVDLKQQFFDLTRTELLDQIAQAPDDARHHLFMGSFLSQYRLYRDAISYVEKAHALSPQKQSILFELGTNYINAGDAQSALAAFKQAFELLPTYREARVLYAVFAVYAKDFKLAEEILTPEFETAVIPDQRLAKAYFAVGAYGRSAAVWKRIVETSPREAELHFYLAGAYLQNGERAKAIQEIKRAVEKDASLKPRADEYLKNM